MFVRRQRCRWFEQRRMLPRTNREFPAGCSGQYPIMQSGQQSPSVMPGHRSARHPGVLRLMLKPQIMRAALKVSLVVGTVLNVINNGQQFWAHHTVNLWQVAMNFVVPYCVSSYSAARNEAQRMREG